MSWCRQMIALAGRNGTILLALLLVAGCGFSPLYGERGDGPIADELGAVEVEPIDHELGVVMRNRVRDNLARHNADEIVRYILVIQLSSDNIPLITERDSQIRRFDYALTATYQLIAISDGAVLHNGSSRIVSSYNIIDSANLASLVAEQSAGQQAAKEISREIVTGLSLYFDGLVQQ